MICEQCGELRSVHRINLFNEEHDVCPYCVEDAFEQLACMCRWDYNEEHLRWDTGCGDEIALHNEEAPLDYGFVFCPYCGDRIFEVSHE